MRSESWTVYLQWHLSECCDPIKLYCKELLGIRYSRQAHVQQHGPVANTGSAGSLFVVCFLKMLSLLPEGLWYFQHHWKTKLSGGTSLQSLVR